MALPINVRKIILVIMVAEERPSHCCNIT
ncbi:hypothetical protein CCACVL1_11306 [Corchorus capsularis]|uniref:Uncharacterized protein n=1 Tax=Corchorus capsularis TaxID=210143 RepID=A0A1R3IM58_COCAP|nr:hypothetical protein CCACVL1_11306 [Corchorus capsularis]